MNLDTRIFVAGHRGMVGSAIVRALQVTGFKNIITRPRSELDLMDQHAVRAFFQREKIEQVYLAAARVGGIHANNTYPAEFIYQNLMIQTNVIHESWQSGVSKLLFLGSSCIYPRNSPQPIKEEYLLTGPLETTNKPYAIAKITGIAMCESYNRQYGTDFRSVMPCNLYGPGDNYHPEDSHVIPALIRRIHEAKTVGANSVTIWGTGTPKREFLYVDDMATGCISIMSLEKVTYVASTKTEPTHVNLGTGEELSISELALLICKVIGYKGNLKFSPSIPDGTPRKRLDISRLKKSGFLWNPIPLEAGLVLTYEDFKKTLPTATA